jgi:ubiquinone/menaquinone biosynthesis C-methylase UbiE
MSNDKKQPQITWNTQNVFSGTAWYYSRYRPGYPEEMFQLLKERFSLDKFSRVLDLGCGTGQIALPMAPYVAEVIAIDPQEEMLKETHAQLTAKNIKNVRCISGESAKLPVMAAEIGEINLTVIARAFHWMNRKQTLKDLYRITKPGGGVAIVGDDSGPRDSSKLRWKEAVDQTVKHWLGNERKAGTGGTYSHPDERFEVVLQESEFQNYEAANFDLTRTWTIDQIIGYLYSTSYCSLPVLGNKKEAFEADIRARLREQEPTEQFKEQATVQVMWVRR